MGYWMSKKNFYLLEVFSWLIFSGFCPLMMFTIFLASLEVHACVWLVDSGAMLLPLSLFDYHI